MSAPNCLATNLPIPTEQWGSWHRSVVEFRETVWDMGQDGTATSWMTRGGVCCSTACLVDYLTGDTRIPIDRDRPCHPA